MTAIAGRIYYASAGEKSHQATPHKKQEIQKQGQSWKSPDFQAALGLFVGFLMIGHYLPWAGSQLGFLESMVLQLSANPANALGQAWIEAFAIMIRILLPITLPLVIAGLFASSLEKGFRLSFSGLKADFTKINPVEGLKRLFSQDSMWQLGKGVLKIAIMGSLAAWLIHRQVADYAGLMAESLGGALHSALSMMGQVLLLMSLAFFIIGIADMGYQSYAFQQKIRMTTQEVRDEFKNTEGDPRIKGKRRELARRIWRSGVRQVKNAQVVVTNPTHYAVALQWDEKKMAAPIVVAKGVDGTAKNIRDMAMRYEVPIVENPPLARSLYELPIGQAILEEHYQAVADILAFLIRKRQGRPMGRREP
ncbi:MAG: type III secretion protein [Sulfobacillus thermosulfidooxidans]|nr:MAG: type III secretion protein [Sulfobacillus thermosulfidooxidans]